MKTILILILTFLFCVPWAPVKAQTETENDKQLFDDDGLGDRLGKEIERAVEHITSRWDDQLEKRQHQGSDDTLTEPQQRLTLPEIEEAPGTHIYSAGTVINDSDIIDNNVVVKNGDLTVYGLIHGNVLVVGGDLQVKRHGKITGDVRVIDGNILKEDGAVIEGFEDKISSEAKPYRETHKHISRSSRAFDVPWASEQTN
ncbi:MAG TPA: polymer-forming cytoskeletal protein, partial [Bacteroidota bacterium]|nr:polymer-forming cytoskeletal protein [Bacteroidota bacterium]